MLVGLMRNEIDGVEERENIILDLVISNQDSLIRFTYKDPQRLNGRHFAA